jgi:hypothetical protein
LVRERKRAPFARTGGEEERRKFESLSGWRREFRDNMREHTTKSNFTGGEYSERQKIGVERLLGAANDDVSVKR